MYEMKKEYMLGITQIDNEHSKLFEIADKLYELINFEFIPDKFDYIMTVIDELKLYAKYHFESEEAYMESINYKKMFSQKIDHNNFINKMEEYSPSKIDENQVGVCKELLSFITEWLVSHILEKDMEIAKSTSEK